MSKAPKTYRDFVARHPGLAAAWDKLRRAEASGPLDEKTARLLKLAVACGAMRHGAVSSAARKARAAGASSAEIRQVVDLAASTIGLPAAVAVFSWLGDEGE